MQEVWRTGHRGGDPLTTWRTGPDGRRTWYVPAHRAYAAAMVEHDELTDE